MATKVVAFDIDGALTKEEGVEKFREEKIMGNLAGIVSARDIDSISRFISSNDIQPCFTRSALLFKGAKLRQIKRRTDADEYIYYGSWERDELHAAVSGWQYKEL